MLDNPLKSQRVKRQDLDLAEAVSTLDIATTTSSTSASTSSAALVTENTQSAPSNIHELADAALAALDSALDSRLSSSGRSLRMGEGSDLTRVRGLSAGVSNTAARPMFSPRVRTPRSEMDESASRTSTPRSRLSSPRPEGDSPRKRSHSKVPPIFSRELSLSALRKKKQLEDNDLAESNSEDEELRAKRSNFTPRYTPRNDSESHVTFLISKPKEEEVVLDVNEIQLRATKFRYERVLEIISNQDNSKAQNKEIKEVLGELGNYKDSNF